MAKKSPGIDRKEKIPNFTDIIKIIKQDPSLLDDEGKELLLAYNKLIQSSPTSTNYRHAIRYRKQIQNWYYVKSGINEKIFFGAPEVLDYLKEEMYKIEKTTFYTKFIKGISAKKEGTITYYLKTDVDARIKELGLQKLDGSEPDGVAEKLKWEAEIAKQKAELLRRRNEIEAGIYILRSEVEHQFAARAAFLKSSMIAFFQSAAPRIVEKVNGDPRLIPEVTEFCLAEIEALFDRYSKPIIFDGPRGSIIEVSANVD